MTAIQTHPLGQVARALVVVLAVAGCDDPPPSPMALMQAAARPDGDAEQARAAFTGQSLRGQLEIYFGERFAEEPGAALQPPQGAAAR